MEEQLFLGMAITEGVKRAKNSEVFMLGGEWFRGWWRSETRFDHKQSGKNGQFVPGFGWEEVARENCASVGSKSPENFAVFLGAWGSKRPDFRQN
jgi:hypothetical protein